MIDCFASFLELFCMYFTAKSFLEVSIIPNSKDIIAGIAILFTSLVFPPSYGAISMVLGQIFYLIYVCSLQKDSLINRIIAYCLSYSSILLSQFIIIALLSLTHIVIPSKIMPLAGNLMTILLLFVMFTFFHFQNLYQSSIKAALPYKLLLINCYFILTAVLIYFKIDLHNFYNNVTYLAIILILIISANVCVLYYDQKLCLKQQEVLSYQKNLPIYQSLIDEIRATQHEYSNRIQMYHNLPNVCKDYSSLCNALQQNTTHYSATSKAYPLLQLNMPLVAASLYNLYSQALKNNIYILFDVESTTLQSNALEYQLADYVCILTQNAIEACKSGDYIYATLNSHDGTVQYEIRNPIDHAYTMEELSKFFQKNYSTKLDNPEKKASKHGLGLYYLSNAVASINGSLGAECYYYEDQDWISFTLEV